MDRSLTYIVTGCTGYVGNVLTQKLLSEGCRVVGMARSRKKAAHIFGNDIPELVLGDITNASDVEKLFSGDGPIAVLHTAAKVSIGETPSQEVYRVTVQGTKNVVDACCAHNAVKLLHISSTEAFPRGYFPDEELKTYAPDPAQSRKGYPRAKSAADQLVLRAAAERGLNASILMFASVLGPGDYSGTHMTQMFIDYMTGRLPASVNAGYNDFDIRDVADVLPAIFERAERGECYLFAHQPNRINDCLAVIQKMTGAKRVPTLPLWTAYLGLPFLRLYAKLAGKRPLYTGAALAALRERADFPIEKARRVFGYAPRPLEETVRDHIAFLQQEGMVRR